MIGRNRRVWYEGRTLHKTAEHQLEDLLGACNKTFQPNAMSSEQSVPLLHSSIMHTRTAIAHSTRARLRAHMINVSRSLVRLPMARTRVKTLRLLHVGALAHEEPQPPH